MLFVNWTRFSSHNLMDRHHLYLNSPLHHNLIMSNIHFQSSRFLVVSEYSFIQSVRLKGCCADLQPTNLYHKSVWLTGCNTKLTIWSQHMLLHPLCSPLIESSSSSLGIHPNLSLKKQSPGVYWGMTSVSAIDVMRAVDWSWPMHSFSFQRHAASHGGT